MSVHLLKPALRIHDIYAFGQRQEQWHTKYKGGIAFPVWTSRKPSRMEGLIEGGSVFWIINKAVQVRQKIIGLENYQKDEDEKPSYLIMCETQLIRTEPLARKPFQGWRYLEGANAPKDIGPLGERKKAPPAELEKDLREAGLL